MFKKVKKIEEATHFQYKDKRMRKNKSDGFYKIYRKQFFYDEDGVLLDIFGFGKEKLKVTFYKEFK